MGRARVVAPPPQDHIPEPLVSPPPPPEEVVAEEWIEGNMEEEIIEVEIIEPSPEELEKERIAQDKYEELQRKKVEEESRLSIELQSLREENERLTRENNAVAKAREEQIIKTRQQVTDKQVSQLNMVEARKPSLVSKIKSFLKRRRIKSATNPLHTNYEFAIIQQASVAVPKMLDDMEKMHENLVILEELLVKYKERQKITESEKRPRH